MSGPEGTPNGVDRLARIEASWDKKHSYGWVMIREEDARALVEIAKAAREQAHEHPDEQWGYDAVGIHVYDGPDNAGKGCPQCDALARLDRPSSDGTADSGAAEEDA